MELRLTVETARVVGGRSVVERLAKVMIEDRKETVALVSWF